MTDDDPWTEARFWQQIIGDSKRAIICEPDLEIRIRGFIDALGMADTFTLYPSEFCPPGRIIVIDELALEAALRQTMIKPSTFWPKP